MESRPLARHRPQFRVNRLHGHKLDAVEAFIQGAYACCTPGFGRPRIFDTLGTVVRNFGINSSRPVRDRRKRMCTIPTGRLQLLAKRRLLRLLAASTPVATAAISNRSWRENRLSHKQSTAYADFMRVSRTSVNQPNENAPTIRQEPKPLHLLFTPRIFRRTHSLLLPTLETHSQTRMVSSNRKSRRTTKPPITCPVMDTCPNWVHHRLRCSQPTQGPLKRPRPHPNKRNFVFLG